MTAYFTSTQGQFFDPNGKPWQPRGVNAYDWLMSTIVTGADGDPLVTTFPGINCVRLNAMSYQPASAYATFFSQMAALGILVLVEDHNTVDAVLTGDALATELAWYTELAAANVDNPYLAFAGMNEPGGGDGAQQMAIYEAIRGTGNGTLYLFESTGGGNPGTVGINGNNGSLTADQVKQMSNTGADIHFYGWVADNSTDQATVSAALMGSVESACGILAAQSLVTADGVPGVWIGEFGDSSTSGGVVVDWQQVIKAVTSSGYGGTAWAWNPGGNSDLLLNPPMTGGANELTAFGQLVATWIATGPNPPSPPGSTPPPTPVTPPPTPVTPPPTPTPPTAAGLAMQLEPVIALLETLITTLRSLVTTVNNLPKGDAS